MCKVRGSSGPQDVLHKQVYLVFTAYYVADRSASNPTVPVHGMYWILTVPPKCG